MSTKRIDPDSIPAIAARLKALRKLLSPASQAEFARMADIPKNTWNTYETGAGRIPIDAAMRLYRIWNVSPDWIYLGVTGNMPYDLMNKLQEQMKKDAENDNGEPEGRRRNNNHG